jgi:hypothetical protein
VNSTERMSDYNPRTQYNNPPANQRSAPATQYNIPRKLHTVANISYSNHPQQAVNKLSIKPHTVITQQTKPSLPTSNNAFKATSISADIPDEAFAQLDESSLFPLKQTSNLISKPLNQHHNSASHQNEVNKSPSTVAFDDFIGDDLLCKIISDTENAMKNKANSFTAANNNSSHNPAQSHSNQINKRKIYEVSTNESKNNVSSNSSGLKAHDFMSARLEEEKLQQRQFQQLQNEANIKKAKIQSSIEDFPELPPSGLNLNVNSLDDKIVPVAHFDLPPIKLETEMENSAVNGTNPCAQNISTAEYDRLKKELFNSKRDAAQLRLHLTQLNKSQAEKEGANSILRAKLQDSERSLIQSQIAINDRKHQQNQNNKTQLELLSAQLATTKSDRDAIELELKQLQNNKKMLEINLQNEIKKNNQLQLLNKQRSNGGEAKETKLCPPIQLEPSVQTPANFSKEPIGTVKQESNTVSASPRFPTNIKITEQPIDHSINLNQNHHKVMDRLLSSSAASNCNVRDLLNKVNQLSGTNVQDLSNHLDSIIQLIVNHSLPISALFPIFHSILELLTKSSRNCDEKPRSLEEVSQIQLMNDILLLLTNILHTILCEDAQSRRILISSYSSNLIRSKSNSRLIFSAAVQPVAIDVLENPANSHAEPLLFDLLQLLNLWKYPSALIKNCLNIVLMLLKQHNPSNLAQTSLQIYWPLLSESQLFPFLTKQAAIDLRLIAIEILIILLSNNSQFFISFVNSCNTSNQSNKSLLSNLYYQLFREFAEEPKNNDLSSVRQSLLLRLSLVKLINSILTHYNRAGFRFLLLKSSNNQSIQQLINNPSSGHNSSINSADCFGLVILLISLCMAQYNQLLHDYQSIEIIGEESSLVEQFEMRLSFLNQSFQLLYRFLHENKEFTDNDLLVQVQCNKHQLNYLCSLFTQLQKQFNDKELISRTPSIQSLFHNLGECSAALENYLSHCFQLIASSASNNSDILHEISMSSEELIQASQL